MTDIPILFEDAEALVIDKPGGLPLDRPRAGGECLEDHLDALKLGFQRPPVAVHRLDRDTSGCLLLARNPRALKRFAQAFEERRVEKTYLGIVAGKLEDDSGTIELALSKVSSAGSGWRMIAARKGKPAVTHYRVLERFRSHTHVRVKLETGRTHQIRVHMTHAGYPLVGDPLYAGRFRIPPAASPTLVQTLKEFPRQALHARFLELEHPATGQRMKWTSPLPEDLVWLLSLLRQDNESFV